MLCCRKKRHYYVADEADADEVNQHEVKESKNAKKDKKADKPKSNGANNVPKENDIVEEVQEVVESPIEVRITEASESSPVESGNVEEHAGEVDTPTDEFRKEQTYETQTSVTSQHSVRESINRSRENFFSCNSLNESHLQEVRKSLSSTDERFTEHCRKLRSQLSSGSGEGQVMSYEQMQQAISRLEAAAARLEALSVVGGAKAESGSSAQADVEASPFMGGYDAIANGKLADFMRLSGEIGGDVKTQADIAKSGFDTVRALLVTASKSKKPAQPTLIDLLKPLSDKITEVQNFKDANRTSKFFNHLQTLAESIAALGWVSVEPAPRAYVKDMAEAGQFYSNRVIKEYKGNDEKHVQWARAWQAIWTETIDYIKEFHTTGLSWNPKGGEASAAGSAAPAPPAGGPPAPPPPPPPTFAPPPPADAGSGGAAEDRSQLFAEINRGAAITSGLKKVTDDMKTHKNPNLRANSTVPGVRTGPKPFQATKTTAPKPAPKPQAAPADKPPVFELQDKKWIVEYQVGNKSLVVDDTNLKQVLYIYKCRDSTIQVKGKVNSITLDSCKKVAVAFDSVVSCIDVVNSQSVQAQVFGKCPTVSIDKTDGFQMYLSKDSLDTEIVTAKSSEMNILVPKDDGDFSEFALPEQYKTVWNGKKFTTECTESV